MEAHTDEAFYGHDEKTSRAGILKELMGQKAEVEKQGELASILGTILEDSSVHEEETGEGASKRKIPKGLGNQMEMVLNNEEMTAAEKATFFTYFSDALNAYEKFLKDEKQFLFGLPQIKEMAKGIVGQFEQQPPRQWNWLGKHYSFYFLSPYHSTRAVEIIRDWALRQYSRTADKNLSQFGGEALEFTQKVPLVRTLSNEFLKIGDSKEMEFIGEFKDAYKNRDAWEVMEIAETTTSIDIFRACLELLTGKGRMRWDRKEILKQFNRFQSKIWFRCETFAQVEDTARDLSNFHMDLERACAVLWDADTFASMQRDNESHYAHELEANKNEVSAISGRGKKGITGKLKHMLHTIHDAQHAHQHDSSKKEDYYADNAREESHLFDELIKYGLETGAFSTHEGLYWVVQGLACGIIPPSRAAQYRDTFLNDYPAIEFINGAHPLLGYPEKPVPVEFFRKIARFTEKQFQVFFYDYVFEYPAVKERLDKTIGSGRPVDHDMSAGLFPFFSTTSMNSVLSKSQTGGISMPETGLLSGTQAMESIFKMRIAEGGPRNMEFLYNFADSAVLFDGVLTGKLHVNNSSYGRLSPHSMSKKSRSHAEFENLTGDKDKTMRANLDSIEDKLKMLEPKFFDILFSNRREVKTEDHIRDTIAGIESEYGIAKGTLFDGRTPKTPEELAALTGVLLKKILAQPKGEANFRKLQTSIRDELGREKKDPTAMITEWRSIYFSDTEPDHHAHGGDHHGAHEGGDHSAEGGHEDDGHGGGHGGH